MRSGGVWLIEMMAGQAETVSELLQQQGSYIDIQIYADLAGIERFVWLIGGDGFCGSRKGAKAQSLI